MTNITVGGLMYQRSVWTMTIKNTTTNKIIDNLQVPFPFAGVGTQDGGPYIGSAYQGNGVWYNQTYTNSAYPSYSDPNSVQPHVIKMFNGTVAGGQAGDTAPILVPASTYSTLINLTSPASPWNNGISWTTAPSVSATSLIPVYYPPQRILTAGQSTTFTFVVYRERASTNWLLPIANPDFVIGSVC